MSRHSPKITLLQIRDHARRLQEFALTYSLPEVLEDWKLVGALEREEQILGEAVRRLPPELTALYPQVDWQQIIGTRNRLSHGYDEIDHAVLWDAAKHDAPLVIATVELMLAELPPGTDLKVEEPLDPILVLGRVRLLQAPASLAFDRN